MILYTYNPTSEHKNSENSSIRNTHTIIVYISRGVAVSCSTIVSQSHSCVLHLNHIVYTESFCFVLSHYFPSRLLITCHMYTLGGSNYVRDIARYYC